MVHWVAILPGFMGQGLGRPLVAAVLHRLHELGHYRVFLDTDSGRVPAIRLYMKLGFRPDFTPGQGRDDISGDVVVWRRLQPLLAGPPAAGRPTATPCAGDGSQVPITMAGAPAGLVYCERAASDVVWRELRAWLMDSGAVSSDESLDSVPWERASEGRRVAQFGYRYDYSTHSVDLRPVAPMPTILLRLLRLGLGGLSSSVLPLGPELFTQCIINEYVDVAAAGGDGELSNIPWHTDDAAFGEAVLVFSFGAPRVLALRPPPADTSPAPEWETVAAHGSLYLLVGEARRWQHCIRAGAGLRYSVTFRSARVASL